MKVLVVHCSYQYRGGEDTVVDEEVKLLRAKGVTVELLLFSNVGKLLPKLLQMPFNVTSYSRTRSTLRSFCPDVVHIHNWHFAASASVFYAIKSSGIPFVVTLHNYRLICPSAILFDKGRLFLDSVKQNFPWHAVARGVYRNSKLLTAWMSLSMQLHRRLGTWQLCSRFIVLTPHARTIFLKSQVGIGADRLTVKPNFCSMPVTAAERRTRMNYYLYVGRLSEEKGVRLLLDGFASNGKRVVIAGDGPMLQEVLSRSAEHPNISYVGAVGKKRVVELLSNCSALVFPSIWYEGMPLTIIEAFACSAPVIASRLGAMETMITHGINGLHFEAGNEADFTRQLEAWDAMDDSQQQAICENARNTYENHYTPESNLGQLLTIYNEVIHEMQAAAPRAAQGTNLHERLKSSPKTPLNT